MYRATWLGTNVLILAATMIAVSGCTGPGQYVRNWFKVGPNAEVPLGYTAPQWIDEADVRVQQDQPDLDQWWSVFADPTLDRLIQQSTAQNLSLREAGFRILEARAQLGIAAGNLMPQSQSAGGGYLREAASQVAGTTPGFARQFFDQWAGGFNLAWEIDFWGRFRRAVLAAEDTLGASSANYSHVLVTLRGDVASNYVLIRTLQQRVAFVRANIDLQTRLLDIADRRHKAGSRSAADTLQAKSNLQTAAQEPQLKTLIRQASNRLCVLLGRPPADLEVELGPGSIPTAPSFVAVGIPADLLRRRPDVRRERLAAAQGQQIGIAEASLYPAFAINGVLSYQSENLGQLFTPQALAGNVGPLFQWNILNYGRIRNNIREQDARFHALVTAYQETVLKANAEVEDGLVAFLRRSKRQIARRQRRQYATSDRRRWQGISERCRRLQSCPLLELSLVQQQDLKAQAVGDIAQGLVHVYRALGGGWPVDAPGLMPP